MKIISQVARQGQIKDCKHHTASSHSGIDRQGGVVLTIDAIITAILHVTRKEMNVLIERAPACSEDQVNMSTHPGTR